MDLAAAVDGCNGDSHVGCYSMPGQGLHVHVSLIKVERRNVANKKELKRSVKYVRRHSERKWFRWIIRKYNKKWARNNDTHTFVPKSSMYKYVPLFATVQSSTAEAFDDAGMAPEEGGNGERCRQGNSHQGLTLTTNPSSISVHYLVG